MKILSLTLLGAFCMWGGMMGCASTNLQPIGKQETFQLEEDERNLWAQVKLQEEQWARSGHLYEDERFEAYINEVAQRLVPEETRKTDLSIRIKVVRDPLLNAFAYPDGGIYVHTGILSKMDNEAQLATLLGHEMTHAINRHSLQNKRSRENTVAAFQSIQVLFVPFGIAGSVASMLGSVGAVAAITGYSRELEAEADKKGLELMIRAGYDPHEAPKLFRHIKKDLEEQEVDEPYFFGTHPRVEERIESYTNLIEKSYKDKQGKKGKEYFSAQIGPVILENVKLDLAMGRYVSAEKGLERLFQKNSAHAEGHFLQGEVARQRGGEGDMELALQEYDRASEYAPMFPEPHRGLGLLYYKTHKYEIAKIELRRYLQLAPNAHDRKFIEQYLQMLNKEQP